MTFYKLLLFWGVLGKSGLLGVKLVMSDMQGASVSHLGVCPCGSRFSLEYRSPLSRSGVCIITCYIHSHSLIGNHSVRGSDNEESAFNSGDLSSTPGSGRFPGEGHGNPLHSFCLESPHGQRSMVGYGPWCHKASDTAERLTLTSFTLYQEVAESGYADSDIMVLFQQCRSQVCSRSPLPAGPSPYCRAANGGNNQWAGSVCLHCRNQSSTRGLSTWFLWVLTPRPLPCSSPQPPRRRQEDGPGLITR